MAEQRFAFLVEWLDMQASLIRQYMLFFYPTDRTIEMDDLKNRRKFLRRGLFGDVTEKMLFVGSSVTVQGRQLVIKDYADELTRSKFENLNQKSMALILPNGIAQHLSTLLDLVYSNNMRVSQLKMLRMQPDQARQLQAEYLLQLDPRAACSGPVIALEVVGSNAVSHWFNLASKLGSSSVIVPESSLAAQGASSFFFESRNSFMTTAALGESALLVIKPSAVSRGDAGKVLQRLERGGFSVSALQMFTLNRANAEEFLEVYKGVVPAYSAMVDEMVAGSCIAVAVTMQDGRRSSGEECVQPLRELVGPVDPELARILRPKTLRAEFGKDTIDNAIHCTDLEEDAPLEVEYFFKLLQ